MNTFIGTQLLSHDAIAKHHFNSAITFISLSFTRPSTANQSGLTYHQSYIFGFNISVLGNANQVRRAMDCWRYVLIIVMFGSFEAYCESSPKHNCNLFKGKKQNKKNGWRAGCSKFFVLFLFQSMTHMHYLSMQLLVTFVI